MTMPARLSAKRFHRRTLPDGFVPAYRYPVTRRHRRAALAWAIKDAKRDPDAVLKFQLALEELRATFHASVEAGLDPKYLNSQARQMRQLKRAAAVAKRFARKPAQ